MRAPVPWPLAARRPATASSGVSSRRLGSGVTRVVPGAAAGARSTAAGSARSRCAAPRAGVGAGRGAGADGDRPPSKGVRASSPPRAGRGYPGCVRGPAARRAEAAGRRQQPRWRGDDVGTVVGGVGISRRLRRTRASRDRRGRRRGPCAPAQARWPARCRPVAGDGTASGRVPLTERRRRPAPGRDAPPAGGRSKRRARRAVEERHSPGISSHYVRQ